MLLLKRFLFADSTLIRNNNQNILIKILNIKTNR